ncbi:MAG TPA: hypothetical protein PKI35_09680 [Bacteroidales bacterium]|nr:hypothetical protein [Bacteroidales bacterium]
MKFETLIILSWMMLTCNPGNSKPVTDYQLFTGWGTLRRNSEKVIVIRQFKRDNQKFYLTVSPETLLTRVINADSIKVISGSWQTVSSRFRNTPYIAAIREARSKDGGLQDAGITKFRPSQKGIDLTIDLCPSHRPLDRVVFTDLIHELGRIESPVPVGISVTGRWMNMHAGDLKWLDSLQQSGLLDIVWINHTYNHNVSKSAPVKKNFMLEPGTDINGEVLKTEVAMLENGILPSVFFRFPGLVSNSAIFDKILNYGLIPVGSDAWLAKGQYPEYGSIVLIHANGNEPVGVRDFIRLLGQKQAEILSKRWELFDLRESIIDDETR